LEVKDSGSMMKHAKKRAGGKGLGKGTNGMRKKTWEKAAHQMISAKTNGRREGTDSKQQPPTRKGKKNLH